MIPLLVRTSILFEYPKKRSDWLSALVPHERKTDIKFSASPRFFTPGTTSNISNCISERHNILGFPVTHEDNDIHRIYPSIDS